MYGLTSAKLLSTLQPVVDCSFFAVSVPRLRFVQAAGDAWAYLRAHNLRGLASSLEQRNISEHLHLFAHPQWGNLCRYVQKREDLARLHSRLEEGAKAYV